MMMQQQQQQQQQQQPLIHLRRHQWTRFHSGGADDDSPMDDNHHYQQWQNQREVSAAAKTRRGGRCIINPHDRRYQIWWYATAIAAIATAFWTPYQIAFAGGGGAAPHFSTTTTTANGDANQQVYDYNEDEDDDGSSTSIGSQFEMFLTMLFIIDIFVQLHLAKEEDEVAKASMTTTATTTTSSKSSKSSSTSSRDEMCHHYLSHPRFWCDLIGVFPFEQTILLVVSLLWQHDDETENRSTPLGVSLVRLVRCLRLYRLKRLSDRIQYNGRIKLLWSTLLRNIAVILFSTLSVHFKKTTPWSLCVVYSLLTPLSFSCAFSSPNNNNTSHPLGRLRHVLCGSVARIWPGNVDWFARGRCIVIVIGLLRAQFVVECRCFYDGRFWRLLGRQYGRNDHHVTLYDDQHCREQLVHWQCHVTRRQG
jgi:Ion transport protein